MALMSKKQSCPLGCVLTKWIVCALLILAAAAALVGMYETHILGLAPVRLQFGSTSGSLAILAFSVAVVSAMKQLVCCMSKCEVCSK
jgi:hypothetical protein